MTARRALLVSAVAAVFVPAISLAVMQATNENLSASVWVIRAVLMAWPPAIMLMASQHATPLAGALAFDLALLVAVLANLVLYMVLGALTWAGLNRHRAWLAPPVVVVALLWWRIWTL